MISPNNIYPPQNWQDFELLCLKLWGEIWNKQDEIEFNSDNASGQDGVDIYCVPMGEKEYHGIQCKNKNLFRKNGESNKLTKATINEEIHKAKQFKPALKKLIIATSIGKDKIIEEYVREINLIHIANNLFSVQICFWDYISRKISEYENVYNWYLKNENFLKRKSVLVTFKNNESEIYHEPEFIKTKVNYRLKTEAEKQEEYSYYRDAIDKLVNENKESFVEKLISFFKKRPLEWTGELKISIDGLDINSPEYLEKTYPRPENDYSRVQKLPYENLISDKQEVKFQIKIHNNGDTVIEDLKLQLSISGNYDKIMVQSPRFRDLDTYKKTTWINDNSGLIIPFDDFIVQQDSFLSNKIILIPKKDKPESIFINWKLLSRDFNDTGQLKILTNPKYITDERTMFVIKETDCRTEIEFSNKQYKSFYTLNY